MAEGDSWDAESFEPEEAVQKGAGTDKWEGEDEDDDVKDNWDDEEEEGSETDAKPTEEKVGEKKKVGERLKDRENLQRQKQEELRRREAEGQEASESSPTEDGVEKALSETCDATPPSSDSPGGASNHVGGIDGICPSSRDDFSEFEKLLKAKITPYDKSIHYGPFLESLFRNLCLSLEVEDMKKINNSLTVLLTEKQKQEKAKAKKKKKGVTPGGGLKAKMKDDLDDYGEFDGGYTQDYEDFM